MKGEGRRGNGKERELSCAMLRHLLAQPSLLYHLSQGLRHLLGSYHALFQ